MPSPEELEEIARKYLGTAWPKSVNATPYEIERTVRLKVLPFLALWEVTREWRERQEDS